MFVRKDGIYLDYNGTAPVRVEAQVAMVQAFEICGNPSAVHAWGRKARQALEEARAHIAHHVGALAQELIFTSGGTEANALALRGVAPFMNKIFVSAIEHDSVVKNACAAIPLSVNSAGQVSPKVLATVLETVEPPFLCSVIWGSNETGVLNDIPALAKVVHDRGGIFHTDAVQIIGKKKISFLESGVDLMTLSAHKMGGPPGIGALVAKSHIPLNPLLMGGGQERGMRSGTPSVALAQGWATALTIAEETREAAYKQSQIWQQQLEESLSALCLQRLVVGEGVSRLPQTTCVTMPGVKADVQLMIFDQTGIAVSNGAACSSGKVPVSPRLLAMGIPENVAETAIRVSWGWDSQASDFEKFLEVWGKTYHRLGVEQRIVCG